jgi:hypothetical protein
MRRPPAVPWLVVLQTLLALAATISGLFWPTAGSPFTIETVRGEMVTLYGQGLYRLDTVFSGAAFRAQDTVTLALGIPLLLITALLYWRGSLRGGLLFLGIQAYFLYVYASMALGASYNPLFLVYIALFSAAFFAFVLAFNSLDLRKLPIATLERLPRGGPAAFMFAGAFITLVVWLTPLLDALLRGSTPALLAHYTTKITDVLDLALLTPSIVIAGMLILRREPLGYRLAFPLLGIIIMLLPVITLSTVYQLRAGIVFSPGEVIGPITGFTLLGLLALWVIIAILQRLPPHLPDA